MILKRGFLRNSKGSTRSILLAGIVAISLAALFALFWPIRSVRLRKSIENTLSSDSTRVQVKSVTFRIIGGLHFDSLRVIHSFERGDSLELSAKKGRIGYMPVAFFAQLPGLVLGKYEVIPRGSSPDHRFSSIIQSILGSPVGKTLKDISLSKATLQIGLHDSIGLSGNGIELSLNSPDQQTNHISGKLYVENGMIGSAAISDFSSPFEIRQGKLLFTQMKADMFEGKIKGIATADLDSARLDTAFFSGSKLDLGHVYASSEPDQGTVHGHMDFNLRVARSRLLPDSISATGKFSLSRVSVRDLMIQRKLFVALLLPELEELKFSRITADFSVQDGDFRSNNLKAEGKPLNFTSKGWINYRGLCEQTVTGTLEKSFVQNLAPVVRSSLETDRSGKGAFACRIMGHIDNPVIELDQTMLNRAVKSVFRELSKELGKFFD